MKCINKEKSSCNVLLVDQGLSFGGALGVIVNIARNLGPAFKPVIVSAICRDVDRWVDTGNLVVESCTPGFTYVDHFRIREFINRRSLCWLRKPIVYAISIYGFFVNLAYVARICLFIRKYNIHVVHANNSVYVAMAARLMRRACIWHFHGVITEPPTLFERIVSTAVKQYVSISNFVTLSAISYGYPAHKITTLHNPVADHLFCSNELDVEIRYKMRLALEVGNKQCLFAIFGRVIRWKGQKELIRAFAAIKDKIDAKIVVVGDATEGFDRSYIEEIKVFVAEAGLSEKVVFLGFTRDIRPIYLAADVVVHASIEPEPFGLVIIEAMAMGKPVIASNLGAPAELVEDGVDGYLISSRNTQALGECMTRLASDQDKRSKLGQNGQRKIRAGYMPQVYADRIGQIYMRYKVK